AAAGCKVGDEVVLLGAQGDQAIHAEELARIAGTIGYEIVTAVSGRVPRIYRDFLTLPQGGEAPTQPRARRTGSREVHPSSSEGIPSKNSRSARRPRA
ncbi:MAG: alanine racemase C-terminal domain-containing protein, partial [Methylacidiphilaceae bacterium]|nr:alanine racemase C-terminal domain-containing protein [Candidatus Methylacidiphilaceae bacterium]